MLVLRRFNSTAAYNATMAQLKQNLKLAMVNKQVVQKNVIRAMMADVKNQEINGAKQDEFSLFKVFSKMVAQRQDSVETYNQQNRSDLAQVELDEIETISQVLSSLPVASKIEVQEKLTAFLTHLKQEHSQLPLNKVFPMINPALATEWKTSVDIIKPLVTKTYKTVFQ